MAIWSGRRAEPAFSQRTWTRKSACSSAAARATANNAKKRTEPAPTRTSSPRRAPATVSCWHGDPPMMSSIAPAARC
eukprot:11158494-Lingulodinium_polyedra.AAC.1